MPDRRGRFWTIGLALLAAACGRDTELDEGVVEAEALIAAAHQQLGSRESPLLTEVVQVIPLDASSRGTLLVDLTTPYIHIYDGEGALQSSHGSTGDGPLEFRTPWRATWIPGGEILVSGDRGVRRIALDPDVREIDRFESPPNLVDLARICGGWTAIVLSTSDRGGDDQQYVARQWVEESREWRWLTPANPLHGPLTLVGRHSRVIGTDSTFAVFDRFQRTIEWIPCRSSRPSASTPVVVPEGWGLPPVQAGAARIGGWLVFFWKSSVLQDFDGTHVSAWNPSTEEYLQRLIPNREVLIYDSGPSSRIFLVFNDLIPQVREVSENALAQVLSLPIEPEGGGP